MLERVLEPEVMNSADEARDYDAMDHSEVNRVFAADFLTYYALGAGLPTPPLPRPEVSRSVQRPTVRPGAGSGDPRTAGNSRPAEALDVGTGTAQIPIEVCRRHPSITIVGVDASAEMIALARANIHAAGFADRIAVDLVDAKTLPYNDMSFPAVMSNSIVHHIPEPRTVLAEMVRVAAPGAVIFVRDLLRPESDTEVARLVALHAGGCNAHQRQLFDDSLRAALSLTEIRDRIVSLGFAAESVQQTTDRHWTWVATVPASASPSARC